MNTPLHCERCGAALAVELGGACPACLWGEPDDVCTGPAGHVLGDELARGGMGVVYEARQRHPDRRVAVKMLLPQLLGEPGLRERFAVEAQAAASLDHPAILPVYAVGESGGVPWFSMKLVRGGTLAERRGRYADRPEDAAALVAQLAAAIGYAHQRGVLHRDLKPGNILFDEGGRAFVSDFGLAKIVATGGEAAELTRSLAFLGTPHYLPPEVARGSLREATTAGDIYALGAILYELLAQRQPFSAETVPGLLRAIADEEPFALTKIGRVPRDLVAITGKCMEKLPGRRYAGAGELEADLRAWLSGKPVTARVAGSRERLWRWARRNPALALTSVGLVAALGAGALLQWQGNRRLSSALAESRISQASLIRQAAGPQARQEALALIRQAAASGPQDAPAFSARLRSEVAAALALPEIRILQRHAVAGSSYDVRPAISGDLSVFAAPRAEGGFAVFRLADGSVVRAFPPAAEEVKSWQEVPPVGFVLDESGSRLAVIFQDQLRGLSRTEVYSVEDGRRLAVCDGYGRLAARPCFLPDGTFLAGRPDGQIDRLGGMPGVFLPAPAETERARRMAPLEFTPAAGGRVALFQLEPTGLGVYALHPPRCLWTSVLPYDLQSMAWSPDGCLLACGERVAGTFSPVSAQDGFAIGLVDAASGRFVSSLPGHGKEVSEVAWLPDGRSLLSTGEDGWLLWQSVERDGFRVRTAAVPGALTVSADGTRFGYAPSTGRIAVAELREPVGWRRWPGEGKAEITCADASADGRYVLLATREDLTLRDSVSGKALAAVPWENRQDIQWPWVQVSREGIVVACDPSREPVAWRIQPGEAGADLVPVPARTAGGKGGVIQGFAPDGAWVMGFRQGNLNSTESDFVLWPEGDASRARPLAMGIPAVGMHLLAPDGRIGLSAHSHQPDAQVWDTGTQKQIATLTHGEPVTLYESPDGSRVVTAGVTAGKLWESGSWRLLAEWPRAGAGRCIPRWGPDGSHFALYDASGTIAIRAGRDGAEWLTLTPPRNVSGPDVLWLGNDRLLLLSASDGWWEWNLGAIRQEAAAGGLPFP